MSLYWFGGDIASYVVTAGSGNSVLFAPDTALTAWNAQTGGTQHALTLADGSSATQVTSSDGTDGYAVGSVPRFQAPAKWVWLAPPTGPRVLALTTDLADLVDAVATALDSHKAQTNGHGTGIADLTDVSVPAPDSRAVGQVLGVTTGGSFALLSPAEVSGALLLDPPDVAGSYVGNTAQPPDPAQGQTGNPWLKLTQPWSDTDDNPDALQFFATSSTGQSIKTGWFNGNGELRAAPSLPNRIAGRVFEAYENRNGPSTGRFFELSTNPLNAANREALFGAYGTAHASMPGWMVATRVLWAQRGVQAGGSFNSLSSLCFRGRSSTTGAPTSGTWTAGDVVIDSAGVVWLCTASGTPGTWAGGGGGGGSNEAAPTAFVNLTLGTGMSHGTKAAAVRIERGSDAIRLRGTLTATAAVAQGAVLATLPTGYRPPTDQASIARYSGGGSKFELNTAGQITYGSAFTVGQSLWLDGLTFDLVA